MPELQLPVSPEEYEVAGSKFVSQPGAYKSKITEMPDWDTPGVSIKFPFTITEGVEEGKRNKLSCGVRADAVWKLKEMLAAIGVPVEVKDGKPTFNPMACIEKEFLSVWTPDADTRTPEEGGKGGTYNKPTGALPIGAKVEGLGI